MINPKTSTAVLPLCAKLAVAQGWLSCGVCLWFVLPVRSRCQLKTSVVWLMTMWYNRSIKSWVKTIWSTKHSSSLFSSLLKQTSSSSHSFVWLEYPYLLQLPFWLIKYLFSLRVKTKTRGMVLNCWECLLHLSWWVMLSFNMCYSSRLWLVSKLQVLWYRWSIRSSWGCHIPRIRSSTQERLSTLCK